jgi:PEGA domain
MEYGPRITMNRFARRGRHRNGRLLLWLLAGLTLLPSGCVRRRLNVHSNPPGALVYVDNQQIGTTPCSVDFTYYGTREIRLVKPGYETLTINQPIPTPWYQIPPLDFVSENFVPNKIRDNRTVCYNLAPQFIVPTQELIDRANQLRQDTQQYPVAPASVTIAPPLTPLQ